jgi:hypothetical protein
MRVQGLLTALLPIFGILGFFFPKTVSVVATLLWGYFLLMQALSKAEFSRLDTSTLDLGPEEKGALLRYAMFFRMPYAAMGISNAGSLWLMACVPWAIILGFKGEWAFIVCPLFVAGTCWYLSERFHTILRRRVLQLLHQLRSALLTKGDERAIA